VTWTVKNTSTGVSQPTGWIDTVYLTDTPSDPLNKNAITMTLGSVAHNSAVNPSATYDARLDVELSPSAVGLFIVVDTDAPQDGVDLVHNIVKEVDETNNLKAVSSIVTPVPADLVVTSVSIPPVNYSGEKMTFTYTVQNKGPNQVWPGTPYWTDFLWVSADPTFDRFRASFLGQTTHFADHPLQPGESYNVSFTATLPAGTGGHYYLYIDPDAHNDFRQPLYLPGSPGNHRLVAGQHGRQLVLAGPVQSLGL